MTVRVLVIAGLCAAAACREDMHDQPRHEAYEGSDFFADGRSSRAPVPGTVAIGYLRDDAALYRGMRDGAVLTEFPMDLTLGVLQRGRERYTIFCAACHDPSGTGQGIIVLRGLKAPASFHDPRLREAPPGHFFDAITHGFGVMPSYAARITPEDRWAIVGYIRALQLSRNAAVADLPPDVLSALKQAEP